MLPPIELKPSRQNLSGRRFGKLTCVHPVRIASNGQTVYRCKCDCGGEANIAHSNLKTGHSQSCGCLLSSVVSITNSTHRRSGTKIYRVWTQMMQRCYKAYAPNYKWYGGRGVTVSVDWHLFEQFYADMGDPPIGYTLDRINANGPYSKQNCRWASRKTQAENTRRAKFIEYNGRSQTIASWERELGVKRDFLGKRLRRGLSVERAFEMENRRAR